MASGCTFLWWNLDSCGLFLCISLSQFPPSVPLLLLFASSLTLIFFFSLPPIFFPNQAGALHHPHLPPSPSIHASFLLLILELSSKLTSNQLRCTSLHLLSTKNLPHSSLPCTFALCISLYIVLLLLSPPHLLALRLWWLAVRRSKRGNPVKWTSLLLTHQWVGK